MAKAILFDSVICIGCGACSAGCKETHHLPGEVNPPELDGETFTIVRQFDEIFVREFCRHCLEPACATACPVGALKKTQEGPVLYDPNKCIGCRYCFIACPYHIPRYQWNLTHPLVRKCDFCIHLLEKGEEPACAQICPTSATRFGEREELLKIARARLREKPEHYFPRIFGEEEVGGSSVLFIADRDLTELDLSIPKITEPLPKLSAPAMKSVPRTAIGLGAIFTGLWWLFKRRKRVKDTEGESKTEQEFIKAEAKLARSPSALLGYLLLAIIFLLGIYASWTRFSKGLGVSTNLSDAVPWGIWIWFDLSIIPLSAGGFIFCALFFLLGYQKIMPVVRAGVLLAFTGYSLAMLGLIYDLGLPLHFWHPLIYWNYHSPMFEVAWCLALYLSVLMSELSIPITEGWNLKRLNTFLHKFCVLLAILGATLSILHQSSLGTVFLLAPEKIHPLWYSSWLPVLFLFSSFPAGIGFLFLLLSLTEKFGIWKIPESIIKILGKMLLASLIIYFMLLLADFIHAQKWTQLIGNFYITIWFFMEMILLVLAPMIFLSFQKIREAKTGLLACSVLVFLGLILNRLNVTIIGFLMQSNAHYFPSWQEIIIMLMLILVGAFSFLLLSQKLPILQKAEK